MVATGLVVTVIVGLGFLWMFLFEKGESSAGSHLPNLELKPLIGIGDVPFGANKEDAIKQFGEPEKVDGRNKSLLRYLSKGFNLQFVNGIGLKFVDCYTSAGRLEKIGDFPGATSGGIRMGSSSALVIERYGQPSGKENRGEHVTLSYKTLFTDFIFRNDKLVEVFMFKPKK